METPTGIEKTAPYSPYPERLQLLTNTELDSLNLPTLTSEQKEEVRKLDKEMTFGNQEGTAAYDADHPERAWITFDKDTFDSEGHRIGSVPVIIPTIQRIFFMRKDEDVTEGAEISDPELNRYKVVMGKLYPEFYTTPKGVLVLRNLVRDNRHYILPILQRINSTNDFFQFLISDESVDFTPRIDQIQDFFTNYINENWFENRTILEKFLENAGKESETYVEELLSDQIAEAFNEEKQKFDKRKLLAIRIPNQFNHVATPNAVQLQLQAMKDLKLYYKMKLRENVNSEEDESIKKGKEIWIKLHLERLNVMRAGLLSSIQPTLSHENAIQRRNLNVHYNPQIIQELGLDETYSENGYRALRASRLDTFIHGGKMYKGEQYVRQLTKPLQRFTLQIEKDRKNQAAMEIELNTLAGILLEKLSADQTELVYKYSLELLEANGWEVEGQDKLATAVDSSKRKIRVGRKTKKTSVEERFPVIIHESSHVQQFENMLSQDFPILNYVGFGRRLHGTEGGAVENDTTAKEKFIGKKRNINTAYARGMRTRELGGNLTEVAAVQTLELLTSDEPNRKFTKQDIVKKAKDMGINRAMRLFREAPGLEGTGFITSSKDLAYAEQAMNVKRLSQNDRNLLNIAGMNAKQYKVLQRLGLIDKLPENKITIEFMKKIAEFIKNLVAPTLQEA